MKYVTRVIGKSAFVKKQAELIEQAINEAYEEGLEFISVTINPGANIIGVFKTRE